MLRSSISALWIATILSAPSLASEYELTLDVVEAATGRAIPCRAYVRDAAGTWYFLRSSAENGTAVHYEKHRANKQSVEWHTTLSAHPAVTRLPVGDYTVTVERGKEYITATRSVAVVDRNVRLRVPLRRWINMASLGWYSGDTHVHRELSELPNVLLAEDLNVALPLTYWVRKAFQAPSSAQDLAPRVIEVDAQHVIYPINTEYEIFSVAGKRHTLGAFFALNHRSVLEEGVPPLAPALERIRSEGALIELDKHCWPWSMALIPILQVDLFELSNNHIWRTEFGFRDWGEPAAEYMQIERDEQGWTERGWIDYGFKNYYALLNCGFRLRPTAGTASGVHPVPLGFGRVYVHLPDGFSYEKWIAGLDAGRSFVTTGPMILARVDDKVFGETRAGRVGDEVTITGEIRSQFPLETVELVVNGQPRTLVLDPVLGEKGTQIYPVRASHKLTGSSWLALRCFEKPPLGRHRFAHSAPTHLDVDGRSLRPRRVEVEYLIQRVEGEIGRSEGVLPAAAIAEYRQALDAYRGLLEEAR